MWNTIKKTRTEKRVEDILDSLDFSNESFAKSKFLFALIIEEKHTVWYNNMD